VHSEAKPVPHRLDSSKRVSQSIALKSWRSDLRKRHCARLEVERG
jgi:hypothetical protein